MLKSYVAFGAALLTAHFFQQQSIAAGTLAALAFVVGFGLVELGAAAARRVTGRGAAKGAAS